MNRKSENHCLPSLIRPRQPETKLASRCTLQRLSLSNADVDDGECNSLMEVRCFACGESHASRQSHMLSASVVHVHPPRSPLFLCGAKYKRYGNLFPACVLPAAFVGQRQPPCSCVANLTLIITQFTIFSLAPRNFKPIRLAP